MLFYFVQLPRLPGPQRFRSSAASDVFQRQLFAEAAQLRRCYMFGGMFWHHFGHFLFETLARLWAVAQLSERIDGIVFFVPRTMDGIGPMHQDVFPLMGLGIPILLQL